MAKQFGSQLDLQKIPLLNVVIHSSTSEPTSPVNGQFWFDTTGGVMKVREGGAWLLVANVAGGTNPTGPAGGDLAGSYPNPTIGLLKVITGYLADGAVTSAKIADATITDTDVATANKDGADATASMRTLGYTAGKAMPGVARLDQVAVPTATVNMRAQRIGGLAAPSAGTDAANKDYVDGVAQGLDAKGSVVAASVANVTPLSGTFAVDGISLVVNDRVLLKNQTTPAQNGIYVVAAGAWTRATDLDAWAEVPGAFVFVEGGTVNADTGWVSTAGAGGTIGTTGMPWTQFSGAGTYTAGAGMTQTGTTFDVVGTTNRVTVAADAVDISASYVGQATITTLGTITTGVWNGTDVAVADGGTGASTAAAARTNLAVPGKFAGNLGALTAGVEATIAHNLNSTDVVAGFKLVATNFDVELAWRTTDVNTIGVTADIAYAASAVRAIVVG